MQTQLLHLLNQWHMDKDRHENAPHSVNGYLFRRAWDYLVRHLQGNEPQ